MSVWMVSQWAPSCLHFDMPLTVEPSREGSKQDGVHDDTRMSHVNKCFTTGFGVEVGLVDIVGED